MVSWTKSTFTCAPVEQPQPRNMSGTMEETTFDLQSAIVEFLADPARTSLELPHMTTGQRRHTKKLAEGYPELKCESYGLGQERQLHLFKISAKAKSHETGEESKQCTFDPVKPEADHSKHRLSKEELAESGTTEQLSTDGEVIHNDVTVMDGTVKNNFISDWSTEFDHVSIVSIKPQLSENLPQASVECGAKLNLSQICENTGAGEISPDRSTTASSTTTSSGSSPALVTRELLSAGLEVRNTFIHFGSASIDERIIQSMPHGMFKRSLCNEAMLEANAEQSTAALAPPQIAEVAPAAVGIFMNDEEHVLTPGIEVIIEGLTKAPAFNGRNGVVKSFDEDTSRYNILLSAHASSDKHLWAKIKRENLRLATPSPPQQPPALCLEDCNVQMTDPFSFPDTPIWCENLHAGSHLTALV